jgi:hypothetical protein
MGFLAGRDPKFQQLAGVYGESDQQGVTGLTTVPGGTGVFGGGTDAAAGRQIGVRGETTTGTGVQGKSIGSGALGFLAGTHPVFNVHTGVYGESDNLDLSGHGTKNGATGVFGFSEGLPGNKDRLPGEGVRGETRDGVGVQGQATGSGLAGRFLGNVEVTGDITLTGPGQDCAEEFDVADTLNIEPGTVMVIEEDGMLKPSSHAYDKKVAGVVSGAGEYKPAIVLGRHQRDGQQRRVPVALVGKVNCKVDARCSPIEVGDLLNDLHNPRPRHEGR